MNHESAKQSLAKATHVYVNVRMGNGQEILMKVTKKQARKAIDSVPFDCPVPYIAAANCMLIGEL